MRYLHAERFLSPDICVNVVQAHCHADWRASSIGTRGNIEEFSDADVRRCKVTVCNATGIPDQIAERARRIAPESVRDRLHFAQADMACVASYSCGDFFGWHVDRGQGDVAARMRWLSFSVQLSEASSYSGGELEFHSLIEPNERRYLRQRGNVIFFPADTPHRVTPVEKGVRFAIVGWLHLATDTWKSSG